MPTRNGRICCVRRPPDEVHLVLPATLRADAIAVVTSALSACRVTHACLTKLDELPDDRVIADVAARLDLPIRWVTTGQSVPNDMHIAKAAIMSALGLPLPARRGAAA